MQMKFFTLYIYGEESGWNICPCGQLHGQGCGVIFWKPLDLIVMLNYGRFDLILVTNVI